MTSQYVFVSHKITRPTSGTMNSDDSRDRWEFFMVFHVFIPTTNMYKIQSWLALNDYILVARGVIHQCFLFVPVSLVNIIDESPPLTLECCVKSGYQGQGHVITSQGISGMQLLVPDLETSFWHTTPELWRRTSLFAGAKYNISLHIFMWHTITF